MEILGVVGVIAVLWLFGMNGQEKRARRTALVNELVTAGIYTKDRTAVDWLLAQLLLLYPQGASSAQIKAYVKDRTDLSDALLIAVETGDLNQIASIMRVRGATVTPATLRAALGKVR